MKSDIKESLIIDLIRLLMSNDECCCHKPRARKVQFEIGPVSARTIITKEGGDIMSLILTDEQKVSLSVSFVDRVGNPAKIDGAPVWSVSDATVVSLAVAEDGLSAVASSVGPLGTSQVSVSADADLGEGAKPITGTLDIEVVAAEAATVGISAGTPEAK